MRLLKTAILNTLAYSDIFDFPLTEEEIWKYLDIENIQEQISLHDFRQELKNLGQKIIFSKNYFCFKGREELIKKRINKEKLSEKKLVFAKKISKKLVFVPTIDLIAVSGSLAVKNAQEEDDIDLFIISKKNTVWVTRILSIVILEILGVRRRRNQKNNRDKICLNMFLDKRNLTLPKKMHSYYTAREITQMNVLFNRNSTFEEFMNKNIWAKKLLPHAILTYSVKYSKNSPFIYLLSPIENTCKFFQLLLIKKHQSKETITESLLAFHPIDRVFMIKKELQKRVKKYEI